MDFKSMLNQLSQLSEATKETPTGKIHKAEPGGYGRKFDTDEEGDEKKDKAPAVKRGRGRPKKGADSDTGEVKTYSGAKDLQSAIVGNLPKGKLPGKASKKHSLKEWVEEVEQKYVQEAAPGQALQVKPMQGAAQLVDPATQKVVATGKADKINAMQKAMAQGEVQMPGKMEEGSDDYSAKKARAGKDIGKPGKQFAKIAKSAAEKYGSKERGEKVAGAVLAKLRKTNEGEIPHESGVDNMGAALGAGRSQTTLESAKPDFIDLDKDGNKKESMKKAADDAKKDKKKVNESMHKHSAAKLMGKAHALAKEGYNCKYDDVEEAKMYHEGYKEGLDECYGMGGGVRNEPIVGMEEAMPATVPGMASQAMPTMEDDVEEGNAFTAALKATPKGEKFTVGGKTFVDRSNYEESMAFESWDKELSDLLTEGEKIDEGMSVSISKGHQGSPDTVSVTAQDAEADQLLGLIKQAGLGLFGGEEASDYGAPQGEVPQHGGLDVVGDHDGMMALIKKVAGGEAGNGDYADEEGHEEDHEECDACGSADCQCDDKEMVDEVESEDQMTYEIAEDNPPDSDEAETAADEDAEAAEDEALAKADELKEWANQVGKGPGKGTDASFEQDIEFMTKVISGGLNKPKSTGQTTIPVIAGQETRMEDPSAWARLAGIKK